MQLQSRPRLAVACYLSNNPSPRPAQRASSARDIVRDTSAGLSMALDSAQKHLAEFCSRADPEAADKCWKVGGRRGAGRSLAPSLHSAAPLCPPSSSPARNSTRPRAAGIRGPGAQAPRGGGRLLQ